MTLFACYSVIAAATAVGVIFVNEDQFLTASAVDFCGFLLLSGIIGIFWPLIGPLTILAAALDIKPYSP